MMLESFKSLFTEDSIAYLNGSPGREWRGSQDRAYSHQSVIAQLPLFTKVPHLHDSRIIPGM